MAGERFASLLAGSKPRSDLLDLWEIERRQVGLGLQRFSEDKYSLLVDKGYMPSIRERAAEQTTARQVERIVRLPVVSRPFVENVKAFVGRLPKKHRFDFDIGLAGRHDVAIEIIRSQRYGSRKKSDT